MPKRSNQKRPSRKQHLAYSIVRIMEMLRSTQAQLNVEHPFFDDAALVVGQAKLASPNAGLLAISLVSIGLAELLHKRGCSAKICLVAAMGVVEERMHTSLIQLFDAAFVPSRPGAPMLPPIEGIIQAIMADNGMLDNLPDGPCKIKVGGETFDAIKVPFGKPKGKKKAGKVPPATPPGNPMFN